MAYYETATSSAQALQQAQAKDPEASLKVEKVGEGKYLVTPTYGQAKQMHTRTETVRPMGKVREEKVGFFEGGRYYEYPFAKVQELSEEQKLSLGQAQMQKAQQPQPPKGYTAITMDRQEAMYHGLISRYEAEQPEKTVTVYVPAGTTKEQVVEYAGYLKEKWFDRKRDRQDIGKGRVPIETWKELEKTETSELQDVGREWFSKVSYTLNEDFLGLGTVFRWGENVLMTGSLAPLPQKEQDAIMTDYVRRVKYADYKPIQTELTMAGATAFKVGSFYAMSRFPIVGFGATSVASAMGGYSIGTGIKLAMETQGKATPQVGEQIARSFAGGFILTIPAQLSTYSAGVGKLFKPQHTYQVAYGKEKFTFGQTPKGATEVTGSGITKINVFKTTTAGRIAQALHLQRPTIAKNIVYSRTAVTPKEYAFDLARRGDIRITYFNQIFDKKGEILGYYNQFSKTLGIKSSLTGKQEQSVFSHELLHWSEPKNVYWENPQFWEARAYKFQDKAEWFLPKAKEVRSITLKPMGEPTKVGEIYGVQFGKEQYGQMLGIGEQVFFYRGQIYGKPIDIWGGQRQFTIFKAGPKETTGLTTSLTVGKFKVGDKPFGDLKAWALTDYKGVQVGDLKHGDFWAFASRTGGFSKTFEVVSRKPFKTLTEIEAFKEKGAGMTYLEKEAPEMQIVNLGKGTVTEEGLQFYGGNLQKPFAGLKQTEGIVSKELPSMEQKPFYMIGTETDYGLSDFKVIEGSLLTLPQPAIAVADKEETKSGTLLKSAIALESKIASRTKTDMKIDAKEMTMQQELSKIAQALKQQTKQKQATKQAFARLSLSRQMPRMGFKFPFGGGFIPIPIKKGGGMKLPSVKVGGKKIRFTKTKTDLKFNKLLKADLFSVTKSQFLFGGKATHPKGTKKQWAEAEKSFFLDVPTIELAGVKGKLKKARKLI